MTLLTWAAAHPYITIALLCAPMVVTVFIVAFSNTVRTGGRDE